MVERDAEDSVIHANVKMDGSRAEALMIPAGGLRLPSTPETAVLEDVGDNNLRAKDHLFMDGSAIFNFVQTEVPPLIEDLLAQRRGFDGRGGLFSVPSAEPFHAAEAGGQNESALRQDAEQCGGAFRQQRRRDHPDGDGIQPAGTPAAGKSAGLPGGVRCGLDLGAMLLKIGKFDFNNIIEYK